MQSTGVEKISLKSYNYNIVMPEDRRRAARRDTSIHWGSYRTGNTPRPFEGPKRRARAVEPDISESSQLLEKLKDLGIDPFK